MKKYLNFTLALSLIPLHAFAVEPTIQINEVAWMGTTASANAEWIELYNPTNNDVDLTGWKLEAADGSPAINLTGSIVAGGYFILERTSDATLPTITANQIYTGALGNTGEDLRLKDNNGTIVDEINATAAWPGGDNTTKQTLERATDGSWQTSIAAGGTPNAASSIVSTPPPTDDADNGDSTSTTTPTYVIDQGSTTSNNGTPIPTADDVAKKGDIVINEIFPWPGTNQNANEFIELKNISAKSIDLTSWKLKTGAGQEFILPSVALLPNSLVTFYRAQTNLALNNTKDKITLSTKSHTIIDTRSYDKGDIDQSYQRTTSTEFTWSAPTPNNETTATVPVVPTAVVYAPKTALVGELINLDASDSFDPLGRTLMFTWNFGDGRITTGTTTRQVYSQEGKYDATLNITAGPEASTTIHFKIAVTDPNTSSSKTKKAATSTDTIAEATSSPSVITSSILPAVMLSEFLPNPKGTDSQLEFIELYNDEARPVELAGFKIDDAEGGSKPFTFPAGTIIGPKSYRAFFSAQTHINLNNSGDSVRLLSPTGDIMDYAEYQKTAEGSSFVRDESFAWQESTTPSPNEMNVLAAPGDESTASSSATSSPRVLGTSIDERNASSPSTSTNHWRYLIAAMSGGVALVVILGYQGYVFIKNRKV